MNLYSYCGNNPINRYDPLGHSWESFWKSVGNWFTYTFGSFVNLSHNVANEVHDFFFFGYEEGISVGGTLGNDSKPISFFAKNAGEWWKFWEYQVGLKINIGKFSYSYSFGVGESNWSLGFGDSTFDVQIGINKIGVGTSRTVNGIAYYNQYYIRTIPTLALVLVAIFAPQLLPTAGGLAFGY